MKKEDFEIGYGYTNGYTVGIYTSNSTVLDGWVSLATHYDERGVLQYEDFVISTVSKIE